jgi:hypothetical protein
MLDARPLHNAAASVIEDGDTVTLAVPTERPRWHVPPLSWIVRLAPQRTVRLDRLGTEVWRLCDGERTVEAVVEAFAERHGLSFHEGRVAVTGYLRMLVQRGALAVAMADDGGAGA